MTVYRRQSCNQMGAQGAWPVVGLPSRNVGWGVRIRLLKDAGAKVKGI